LGWGDNELISSPTSVISTAQKQYTKAVKHIQDAEKLALGYFKNKSRELAKLYVEYGDACRNLGQTERAMGFYQKAVINAWPEFHKTDIQANPDTISIPAEEWAIQSLIRKAELLLASQTPSLEHRLNAATCFDLAWRAHGKLQTLYAGDQSKLALLKRRDDQRKLAAQNLLVISSLQSNPIDQQAAIRRLFDWMESGRALVLRDALTTQKTLENLQLPAETLQEITDLRRDQGVIESQLQEAIALADTAKTEQMRAASYKCSQHLSALQMQLEQDYPAYVKYRTATNTTLANQIQPKLNESEAICSWLSVSDSLLCVVLTHTEAVAFTIPFGVKEQEIIQQYQKLLVDRVAQESDPVAFLDVAHAAYQVLFAKAPAALLNKPNWAMVPDGPLVSLPFDALVKTKGTTNYGSANWLLKEHNIKYLWCAGLALNHSRTDCQPAAVLHFLPFQSHENQEYAALTNSEQEVHTQKRIKSLENQSGTLAAFTDLAHAYSLVHLSTHADPNKIQFSDRGLSLTELYGLTLNNNLVVLSACETNVGKFAEAEGALSLARAFAYAGAQSLISSFWKVNDQSTAGLFAHFYAELEAGKTKSEALHQAKLAFLSNTKHQANQAPWYWAAFSFYGTDGCIKIENAPIPLAWWLAGVLVVCALVFFVVKKKKLA
jgi:CHAT domain-containing protein